MTTFTFAVRVRINIFFYYINYICFFTLQLYNQIFKAVLITKLYLILKVFYIHFTFLFYHFKSSSKKNIVLLKKLLKTYYLKYFQAILFDIVIMFCLSRHLLNCLHWIVNEINFLKKLICNKQFISSFGRKATFYFSEFNFSIFKIHIFLSKKR